MPERVRKSLEAPRPNLDLNMNWRRLETTRTLMTHDYL